MLVRLAEFLAEMTVYCLSRRAPEDFPEVEGVLLAQGNREAMVHVGHHLKSILRCVPELFPFWLILGKSCSLSLMLPLLSSGCDGGVFSRF